MKTPNIFPFTLWATDRHYVSSPVLAERLWMRDRKTVAPPGMSWYGVDLEVRGHDSVKVHVHEIGCGVYGGIGPVIFSYEPKLTQEDLAELRALIREKQTEYADREHARREAQRLAAEVEAIRRELFEPA